MMLDCDDVRALLGKELEQLDQLAGSVVDPCANDEVAAR